MVAGLWYIGFTGGFILYQLGKGSDGSVLAKSKVVCPQFSCIYACAQLCLIPSSRVAIVLLLLLLLLRCCCCSPADNYRCPAIQLHCTVGQNLPGFEACAWAPLVWLLAQGQSCGAAAV